MYFDFLKNLRRVPYRTVLYKLDWNDWWNEQKWSHPSKTLQKQYTSSTVPYRTVPVLSLERVMEFDWNLSWWCTQLVRKITIVLLYGTVPVPYLLRCDDSHNKRYGNVPVPYSYSTFFGSMMFFFEEHTSNIFFYFGKESCCTDNTTIVRYRTYSTTSGINL